MEESQKPFSCTVDGCEMTFTNEDHLNWHHKKHDMVLNLGLANKSAEVADQTPTPTRFIRNCEEVGLFQDLQNVNPFEETFKKAIEGAKTGTLHLPAITSNDDTLHTPHIFPQVEASIARNDNQSTQSNDFCITNVTPLASMDDSESDECYDLTIDDNEVEQNKNKHDELKTKLKETIQNKVKTPVVITPVPIEKLTKTEKRKHDNDESNRKRQKTDKNVTEDKMKIREMNRAAQLRCRKRKQVQRKQMEEDLKTLKNENTRLNHENQNFKHKFYALKELLLNHQNGNAVETTFLAKVEEILNSPAPIIKTPTVPPNKRKISPAKLISPIVPIPMIQPPPGSTPQNPLLIQVLGSVAQLAVSVLPNQ